MDVLREQCPWDKKQTMESLRYLTIEELYELSDAILNKDMEEIKKELGDILLHVVFYKNVSETNDFDISDVINNLCDKLIHRHPHIYGNVTLKNEEEVKENWEKLKLKEGNKSVLEGVPKSLPAIVKAFRIQEKVRGVGFDWENKKQVWEKVLEEIEELKVEVKKGNQDKIESEFGDVLFALTNYSRFVNVNPEDALERTNKRFIKRFQIMEDIIKKDGLILSEMTLSNMDLYWEKTKREISERIRRYCGITNFLIFYIKLANILYYFNIPKNTMKKNLTFLLSFVCVTSVFSQNVFDIGIRNIEIFFSEPNWDDTLDVYYANDLGQRLIADSILIDGVMDQDVGIKYKGNSSYNINNTKNPFNIKLDYVNNGQSINGYNVLKLSNGFRDPSFVREVLTYEMA